MNKKCQCGEAIKPCTMGGLPVCHVDGSPMWMHVKKQSGQFHDIVPAEGVD